MSTSPILSYKKPSVARQEANSAAPSPVLSDADGKFESPAESSSPAGSRKISSRRKALQDFYHIQQQRQKEEQEKQQQKDEPVDAKPHGLSPDSEVSEIVETLNDPEQLNHFIKNTPVEDILKLRNKITSTLNSSDSEKKTIIYDNYYELIKLSQTLDNITKPDPPPKDSDRSLQVGGEDTGPVDQNYIYDSLYSLKDFLDDKMTKLNQDFSSVVVSLQEDNASDANSTAAVKSQKGAEPIVPENVNKSELVREINLVLGSTEKDKVAANIQQLTAKLDPQADELLLSQLAQIKAGL